MEEVTDRFLKIDSRAFLLLSKQIKMSTKIGSHDPNRRKNLECYALFNKKKSVIPPTLESFYTHLLLRFQIKFLAPKMN